MKDIIIIGTGLAGYNLAKEFRKIDKTTPLTLITADDGRFYSKPLLSTALTYGREPTALAISDCEKMSAQLDATIYTQSSVTAIDIENKTIDVYSKTEKRELARIFKASVCSGCCESYFTLRAKK